MQIEKIIIDAGKRIKKSYLDRDMKIHTKSNNEYFTNIDVDTEIFLISRLKKIFIESLCVASSLASAGNMRRLVLTMIKATKIMIPRA